MERLEKKIREAEEFRDKYFLDHPGMADPHEKRKAVREKILPLLQDIPLDTQGSSSATAQYNLICGRILNVAREYDPKCEKHLTHAIKMEPSLSEAWYELGECLWKKKDYESAIDCFRTSLERHRTAKCLCALSMALRQQAQRINSKDKEEQKKKDALFVESSKLCEEAVLLDENDGNAWHALGNAMLLQFFMNRQQNFHLMERARDAYEKALSKGNEYLNPDLHANYATALKFIQDYTSCIEHLKAACLYDPSCVITKEQLQSLSSYLIQLNESVQRKGKLKPKRLHHYQESITKKDLSIYGFEQKEEDSSGKMKRLKEINFMDLKEGYNSDTVTYGKVVGIVPNPETVPYTFVGCDRTGSCIAFSVYNCSSKFGFIIGDSFAVPEPYVIDVKVDGVKSENGSNINFRLVRVTDSWVMAKNGKLLARDLVAYCEMRCIENKATA